MNRRSPFEFDISVKADKKRRSRARGMSGAIETSSRLCQHEGCENAGKYRAPKSPDNLDEFLWFCLDHVRAYNLKWNFFENHSQDELERQFAADKVWERPTQPLGDKVNAQNGHSFERFGFDDPMEVLGENATMNPAGSTVKRRRLPSTERRALAILEAEDTATKAEMRKLYKSLVKALHPDMNGGRRDDEDRLAEVVWAWDQIKDSRSFAD